MTIRDLTDRYNTYEFMRGGPPAWHNSRTVNPVSRGYIHHTAGFYTLALRTKKEKASEAEEIAEIDSIARDHSNRFGIGPGYVYLVFPSGRAYAVGKWGTHRAHTKGRDPDTGKYHNQIGIGVCAVGNYQQDAPTPYLLNGLVAVVREVEELAGRKLPWTGHGETPTVNSAGTPYSQGTLCPGKNLLSWLHKYLADREKPVLLRPRTLGMTDFLAWEQAWRRGTENPRYEGDYERHDIVIPRRK